MRLLLRGVSELPKRKLQGCEKGQKRGDCFTRDCVTQKGLPFCGACELFPCDTILTRERCTVLDKAWLRWKKEQKRQ